MIQALLLLYLGICHILDATSMHEKVDALAPTEPADFAWEGLEARSFRQFPLNPDFAYRDDIVSIIHAPRHSRVKIIMRDDALCRHPVFVGRLSGRALVMVKWEKRDAQTIHGYYSAPLTGLYFFEIIMVYCNYNENDMQQCIVSGENHRVTKNGAVIYVHNAQKLKGYWESPVNLPLYTRWQRPLCRVKYRDQFTERCWSVGSAEPFDRYQFRTHTTLMDRYNHLNTTSNNWAYWQDNLKSIEGKLNECITNRKTEACEICVVGASHSRRLSQYFQAVASVRSGYYVKLFPEDVGDRDIPVLRERCKAVLISFGQWDLRNKTTPEIFATKMEAMLEKVEKHPKVFGRSMHYNPLGDDKMKCSPEDGRTPPHIDSYNLIAKQMFRSRGIKWIDTRWIDGAVWDSALDWNHLSPAVEVVQATTLAFTLKIGIFSSTGGLRANQTAESSYFIN